MDAKEAGKRARDFHRDNGLPCPQCGGLLIIRIDGPPEVLQAARPLLHSISVELIPIEDSEERLRELLEKGLSVDMWRGGESLE